MTFVVDPEELTAGRAPMEEQDIRGSLPVRGLTALAGSAVYAVWSSRTCFDC